MDEWYATPVFNVHDGWFSANIEPTCIGSVERFPDVPRKSELQREAIAEVQRIAEERHFSMGFRPGDIQLINSRVTFHTRSAYEEHPEPERKRHLLRIWLKCPDGRPLPHWFYERHGPRGSVDRPGGIVGPGTELVTPLDRHPDAVSRRIGRAEGDPGLAGDEPAHVSRLDPEEEIGVRGMDHQRDLPFGVQGGNEATVAVPEPAVSPAPVLLPLADRPCSVFPVRPEIPQENGAGVKFGKTESEPDFRFG